MDATIGAGRAERTETATLQRERCGWTTAAAAVLIAAMWMGERIGAAACTARRKLMRGGWLSAAARCSRTVSGAANRKATGHQIDRSAAQPVDRTRSERTKRVSRGFETDSGQEKKEEGSKCKKIEWETATLLCTAVKIDQRKRRHILLYPNPTVHCS